MPPHWAAFAEEKPWRKAGVSRVPQMDLHHGNSSPPTFFLTGVPGLRDSQSWLGVPFCFMYVLALLGNSLLLLTIHSVPSMHSPMFYFLGMLGAVDLAMATAVVPKMLGIFWMDSQAIAFDACFAQMFFIHATTAVESGVLLAMALDRYVAICHPLRYEAILTVQRVVQLGLAVLARGILFMVPLTWMARSLPYCGTKLVAHSYCEHMAVLKLACADWSTGSSYSLVGSTMIVGSDMALIAASYGLILRALARGNQKAGQLKALSTCGSHACVMLLYYLPGLASIYLQHFPQHLAPHIQVLLADLYLALPPMLNPIIYSIRTEQVRKALHRILPLGRGPRILES